jgi:hypothetical protein
MAILDCIDIHHDSEPIDCVDRLLVEKPNLLKGIDDYVIGQKHYSRKYQSLYIQVQDMIMEKMRDEIKKNGFMNPINLIKENASLTKKLEEKCEPVIVYKPSSVCQTCKLHKKNDPPLGPKKPVKEKSTKKPVKEKSTKKPEKKKSTKKVPEHLQGGITQFVNGKLHTTTTNKICQCRIWKGGLGGQCTRFAVDNTEMCKAHTKKPAGLGFIYEPRPNFTSAGWVGGSGENISKKWKFPENHEQDKKDYSGPSDSDDDDYKFIKECEEIDKEFELNNK